LTEKESEIYVFLAKHGSLTGGQISKQTKIHRALIYRILKNLQKKGVVESTLKSPTQFSSIPFERVLDQQIKMKQQEVVSLEKAKNGLLSDWETIGSTKIEPGIGKFMVIEGNRKIYSKITQMIKETKNQLLSISTVADLVRAEQFGVFDALYTHPFKSRIKFRFLTELSSQHLKAMKLLKAKMKEGFDLNGINPGSSFAQLPRMVITDNREILFFISPKSDIFSTGKDEVCIFSNNASLVQALTGIFKDLWRNSVGINQKILEIETGRISPKPLLSQGLVTVGDYDEAFAQVKNLLKHFPLLATQLERIDQSLPGLVGREEELSQLENYAQQALRGNGKTILVFGEAGIGKTRLANEFTSDAKSQDFIVLECRCSNESSISLGPIRKVLRDLFKILKQDTAEVRQNKIERMITRIAPEYNHLIPIIDNMITGVPLITTSLSKNESKMNLNNLESFFDSAEELEALAHLLAALAEKQALILFVDDIHLADSATLKFLQELSGAIEESRFLLVGAYRQEALTITEKANHPFLDFLNHLKRHDLHQRIELVGLSREDSGILVNNVLGVADDLLVKRIYEETGGNPFFILETLRFLINKTVLKAKGAKWKPTKNVNEIEIPSKIHDVISRRINILKEEERDIIDCASVIGEEFSSDLIEAITGINRLRLLKKLNLVERKYQLIHSSGGKFRFDHSKIREVLYSEIAPELRKEYHLLIAQQMEKTFKDNLDEVGNQLAYHYYKAGTAQKAVPYLFEASERARKEWAIFEAIRYYLQALEVMEEDEKWIKKRVEILEFLGSLYAFVAEHEKANECYFKASAITDDEAVKNRLRRKVRRKKIVENNGVKLAYYIYGEGKKTIFFLAWVGTDRLWTPQVNHFSQKYKVVTMDLRGTGESDKPPGDYTVDLFTDDLRVIIEDLSDEEIVFVGLYIGGMVGIKYVTQYPSRISKLVLMSMAPKQIRSDDYPYGQMESDRIKQYYAKALESPSWGIKRLGEIFFPRTEDKHFRERYLTFRGTPPEIVINAFMNYNKEDARPLLRKISIPTLILGFPQMIKIMKYMSSEIPCSKYHTFKTRVFPNLFEAEEFNKILEDFIAAS